MRCGLVDEKCDCSVLEAVQERFESETNIVGNLPLYIPDICLHSTSLAKANTQPRIHDIID